MITGKQVIEGVNKSHGSAAWRISGMCKHYEVIYTQVPSVSQSVSQAGSDEICWAASEGSRSHLAEHSWEILVKEARCKALNIESQRGLWKGHYSSPPSVCVSFSLSLSLSRTHRISDLSKNKERYIFVKKSVMVLHFSFRHPVIQKYTPSVRSIIRQQHPHVWGNVA